MATEPWKDEGAAGGSSKFSASGGRAGACAAPPWRAALSGGLLSLALLSANAAAAEAGPDLAQARTLLKAGQYAQAYALLSPYEAASANDAAFDYLLGRAALGTADADKARALFERSIALAPDDMPARLALGRYAEAKIEFETVLRFGDLPQDLLSQVEIYDAAAREQLDESRALTGFGYAETGVGNYRVNSTRGTQIFGGNDRDDAFFNLRGGGGFNYQLQNGYAIDGSADLRFREYDGDARNDTDLRWHLAGSRALGDGNLAVGLRGRTSYRGDGDWRNDAGIYADYRRRLDPDNQVSFGGEILRREYPQGALRDRSRSSASLTAGWVHSLFDGAGSLSLNGHAGQHFATNRPDGNSDFFGATLAFDYTVNNKLSWGTFAWWERDAYNDERLHFSPDTFDNTVLLKRNDNLYEVGAYLVWEFAPSWTLRPELLWIRDHSNAVAFNYSATEVWINIRKSFP